MDRLCCCLRDRAATRHHPHRQDDDGAAASDDDMSVVELPPLPAPAARPTTAPTPTSAAAAAAVAAAMAAPKPQPQPPQPQPQAKRPAASPRNDHDDDLIGLKEAHSAPSAHHQQHHQQQRPPSPQPSSPAPPASSSPAAGGKNKKAAAAVPQQQSGHSQEEQNVASPLPRSAVASPAVASPATASSPALAATNANANWAEAWAPIVREQQREEAQERAKQEFVAALGKGVVALKHDRKGHARLRELYTPDGGESFSWRAPTGGKEKGGGAGHQRGKSSAGGHASVFERGRVVYAFHEILEVRRGTVPDPATGGKESGTETLRLSCPKSDLYKSFSLILKDRTVDFTCHSIEQMTYLVKGISTQMADQKRALLKAAREKEAPASPKATAAY